MVRVCAGADWCVVSFGLHQLFRELLNLLSQHLFLPPSDAEEVCLHLRALQLVTELGDCGLEGEGGRGGGSWSEKPFHTHLHTHMLTNIRTHTCTCTRTHAHTHTHTHIQYYNYTCRETTFPLSRATSEWAWSRAN